MTVSQSAHARIALVSLGVAAVAGANWYYAPERAWAWLLAMSVMALAWFVVICVDQIRPLAEQSPSERGYLEGSVISAGLLLIASLTYKLAHNFGVDGGVLGDRVMGAGGGVVMMVLGNYLPKALGPVTAARCSPVQMQAMQRFAGWTFMIAGLLYTAAWIFLPVSLAHTVAIPIAATAIVLTLGRLVLAIRGGSRTASSPTA
ncbi:MAG: putative integral rane protein [Caulobacter sp.]|nr:putative integral rane protein [Caulobacter sp.]